MLELECTKCGRGPMRDGTTVYKNGGEYRCEQHLDPEHRNEKALPGVYSEFWRTTDHFPPDWEVGLAHDAYRMADAMLKVRTAT